MRINREYKYFYEKKKIKIHEYKLDSQNEVKDQCSYNNTQYAIYKSNFDTLYSVIKQIRKLIDTINFS